LDIMPLFLRNFFEKLPFAYISYYPAKIFTGAFSVNECLLILLKEVLWIIALYAAGQLIWKKAVKKFTGEGV